MTYGFKMAGDLSDFRVAGMMKEVEDDLHRTLKVVRPGLESLGTVCRAQSDSWAVESVLMLNYPLGIDCS